MRKPLSLAASLLMLFPASQEAGATVTPGPMAYGIQDTSWQQTDFGSAPTIDLVDDGSTDNVETLNNFPDNAHRILNCPHNGTARINSTWFWRTGQRFWLKNCTIESTNTTLNVYAISIPGGFFAIRPITDFRIYGLNFRYATQVSGVRMMLAWIDHFKIINFTIDNTGGFAFLRCSDCEVAYGIMTNTFLAAGSPGLRHIGQFSPGYPKAATSVGMKANAYFHNLNFQTGDSAFQVCQGAPGVGTWLYNVSSDDVLYEDVAGSSNGSLILISEPRFLPSGKDTGPDWTCSNITYRNVTGTGTHLGIIGLSERPLRHVNIETVDFTATDRTDIFGNPFISGLPVLSIGTRKYGPFIIGAADIDDVSLKKISIRDAFQEFVQVKGPGISNVTLDGLNLGAPRAGVNSATSSVPISGATNTVIKNSVIDVGNNQNGISDGDALLQSQGTQITTNVIGDVRNSNSGILLNYSAGARVTGNAVAPALGLATAPTTAQGVAGTANPNGTTGAVVTGNDLSAMPVPIACPPSGQGNFFSGNTGAQPCPR